MNASTWLASWLIQETRQATYFRRLIFGCFSIGWPRPFFQRGDHHQVLFSCKHHSIQRVLHHGRGSHHTTGPFNRHGIRGKRRSKPTHQTKANPKLQLFSRYKLKPSHSKPLIPQIVLDNWGLFTWKFSLCYLKKKLFNCFRSFQIQIVDKYQLIVVSYSICLKICLPSSQTITGSPLKWVVKHLTWKIILFCPENPWI